MKCWQILCIVALGATPAAAQAPPTASFAELVHNQAAAACPGVVGVHADNPKDKSTWRADFAPGTTNLCKTAVQAAFDAFDTTAAIPKVSDKNWLIKNGY